MNSRNDLIQLVARQLGREPSIKFTVVAECVYGWPAVLLCATVTHAAKINPNLYYLSCPYLRRRLARLEDTGSIRRLQAMVKGDKELAADLLKAQEEHRQAWRNAAYSVRDAGEVDKPTGKPREIAAPNIASSREEMLVKCLHAHVAWYLTHPHYRLGRIIAREVGEIWCADETCKGLR